MQLLSADARSSSRSSRFVSETMRDFNWPSVAMIHHERVAGRLSTTRLIRRLASASDVIDDDRRLAGRAGGATESEGGIDGRIGRERPDLSDRHLRVDPSSGGANIGGVDELRAGQGRTNRGGN